MDMVGRILRAALFVAGAVQKGLAPEAAQGLLIGAGAPSWLVWPAAALNAALAVGLIWPPTVRAAAVIAAIYCILTSAFHFLPADGWQMSIFVKNWAIAGGLLVVAGHDRTTVNR